MMLMVPIYSVESYMALQADDKDAVIVWETLRETYEAYVIYCFVRYLISGLAQESAKKREKKSEHESEDESCLRAMEAKDAHHGEHMAGFQYCLRPWIMGEEFFVKVKLGTMAYVWTRLLCTLLTIVLNALDLYDEGNLGNAKAGYLWCTILLTSTQTWALYVLALFYHAMGDDLSPLKPFCKFISVKAVVFFSFWQSIVVVLLSRMGMIPHESDDRSQFNSAQIQDLLICYEMFAASVAMYVAFPADKNGEEKDSKNKGVWAQVRDSVQHTASIVSPEDVMVESEETANLLVSDVEVSGEVQLGLIAIMSANECLSYIGVRVINARNLAAGDLGGLSDPYVKMRLVDMNGGTLYGSEHKTEVIHKTLNPEWNVQFDFQENAIKNLNDMHSLIIEVYDEDFGGIGGTLVDNDLGHVKILRTAFHGIEHTKWFNLAAGHNVYH